MKVLKTVEGLLKAKAIRNPPAWLLAAKQYQPLPRPPKPNELPRHPSQKLLA